MADRKPKLTLFDVTITRLKAEHSALISSFFCNGSDEEDFLKKDALKHQQLKLSETYLLTENSGGKLISYITLSLGTFQISESEPLGGIRIREKTTHVFTRHMPCLLVGKLATHKDEEGRLGGTLLLDFAAQRAFEISQIAPLPFMALHAHLDKVGYYEGRGFILAFKPTPDSKTATMYRNL